MTSSPRAIWLTFFRATLLGLFAMSLNIAKVRTEELCCQNGCGGANLNSVASDLGFDCLQNIPTGDSAISQCQFEASHLVFAESCCANNGNDVDIVHDELFATPKLPVNLSDYSTFLAFQAAGGTLNTSSWEGGVEKRDFHSCCAACRVTNTVSNYCPRALAGGVISAGALLCAAACSYVYQTLCTLN